MSEQFVHLCFQGARVILFDKRQPELVKAGSSAKAQLAALESLRGTLPPKAEKQLEADIRNLRAGIAGEEQVLFELMNSHMDLLVLHDLQLEHNGLEAQIDFLVLTPHRFFVLETKRLYGDIEVTARGDFIRRLPGGRREGIYSPITQNKRHLELIHQMKIDNRGFITNLLVDRDFYDIYRSFVVLANDKTVLHDNSAPSDVMRMIIRADRLVSTIASVNKEKEPGRDRAPRSAIEKNAAWFLEQHKEKAVDYTAKYRALEESERATSACEAHTPSSTAAGPEHAKTGEPTAFLPDGKIPFCPMCGVPMVVRTATRGVRKGKQFFGCRNYPHCREIINID